MFQFRRLASFRITHLQCAGLSHSEIFGYNARVQLPEAYLFDHKVQQFIQEKNPWALRDMAERLLEAQQRGLWTQVDQKTLDQLRAIVHEAEGAIESGQ